MLASGTLKSLMKVALCALAPALAALPITSRAEYPERRVNIIVPFTAGGAVDTIARLFAKSASGSFKDGLIVTNKPGASAVIGESEVARSQPDGYTVLIHSATLAVNSVIYKTPAYDPSELQPVAMLLTQPFLVVTNPESPAQNLQEMINIAKKTPQGILTANAGSSTLLAGQLFRLAADINLTVITYGSGPPAALSLMRNETQLYITDLVSVAGHLKSGKIRALAVTTKDRIKDLPDIPTTAEAGLPAFQAETFFGVYVRRGTPQHIVQKLHAEVAEFLKKPEVVKQIESLGAKPAPPMSVAAFEQYYADQRALWKGVMVKANVPMQ